MSGGERGGKSGRGRGERVEKGLRRHRNAQRRFVTSVASGTSRASGKGEDRSRMGEKGCCGIFFSFSPRFFYLFYFFPLLSSRRSPLFSSLLFLSSFLSSFLFFFFPSFSFISPRYDDETSSTPRTLSIEARVWFFGKPLMSFRGKKIRAAFPTSTGESSWR